MNAAQLEELVKWVSAVGGVSTTVIVWLNNRHKAKVKKIEEESVGKAAILVLERELTVVKSELKELRSMQDKDKEAIERLEDHYSVLIERIFDIYKMKSLKA